MKYLELLRAKLAELATKREAAVEAMEAVTAPAVAETRSMTTEEDTQFIAARDAVDAIDTEVASVKERVAELEAIEARAEAVRDLPQIVRKPEVNDILTDRSATPQQLADAATRSLEEKVNAENMPHVRSILKKHSADTEWARSILARSLDVYASAFQKIMTHREFALTVEERTVLGVSTNANGKFLLPTHLDPTIILTSAMSDNTIRRLARVVTLTDGQPAWNGITSGGVTASWDGEVVEVSDDTPTFGNPSIPTVRAQALVQASISATQDISGLADDVLMMFADAKDRLEGAAYATGSGSTQPKGVFTAVHAVTASRVQSATAAAIALGDLNNVYTGTPLRYRRNGAWVANPVYTVAIKALGTALSASFSGYLQDGTPGQILTKPVYESEDAPTTQTTTALDDEVLFGDFKQYVIVDRPGDMAVEYIPHLFNVANNLPDGRRAWYATWRTGGDCTNTDAFRLLVDKTSA